MIYEQADFHPIRTDRYPHGGRTIISSVPLHTAMPQVGYNHR